MFTFVRCEKVSRADVGRAGAHARGVDGSSVQRRGKDWTPRTCGRGAWQYEYAGDGWREVAAGDARSTTPAALEYAHGGGRGARPPRRGGGAAPDRRRVSPAWVEAGGDPHDIANGRVRALCTAARTWADEQLGGVFAARYDVDEKGSACGRHPLRAGAPAEGSQGAAGTAVRQLRQGRSRRYRHSTAGGSPTRLCRTRGRRTRPSIWTRRCSAVGRRPRRTARTSRPRSTPRRSGWGWRTSALPSRRRARTSSGASARCWPTS